MSRKRVGKRQSCSGDSELGLCQQAFELHFQELLNYSLFAQIFESSVCLLDITWVWVLLWEMNENGVSPCDINWGVRKAEVSGYRGRSMETSLEARWKVWRNLFEVMQGSALGSSWKSQVRAYIPVMMSREVRSSDLQGSRSQLSFRKWEAVKVFGARWSCILFIFNN